MDTVKIIDMNLQELPIEMLEEICQYLTEDDISSLRRTNKKTC